MGRISWVETGHELALIVLYVLHLFHLWSFFLGRVRRSIRLWDFRFHSGKGEDGVIVGTFSVPVSDVNLDSVTSDKVTKDDLLGQFVLNVALNSATQWAGT